jgi:hypothetical protein
MRAALLALLLLLTACGGSESPIPEAAAATRRPLTVVIGDSITAWDNPARWYCSELLEASLAAGGRLRWRLSKRGISPMESWMVL